MKQILYLFLAIMTLPMAGFAQWDASKEYYIQTKEGLCLANQETNDELALIRFAAPNAETTTQKWKIQPVGDAYVISNISSGLTIDNIDTDILNLFQMQTASEAATQQWKIVPVDGKEGYYNIFSVNFPTKNWSMNYNQAVSLVPLNNFKTSQWFRISETILAADNVTEPDPEPVVTVGTQNVKFSTADAPVWYKLNPFYASSGNVNKNNVIAYFETANNRWIGKGASNTKHENATFDDPDVSLWRLEGDANNCFFVNKGTGLKLAYPASNNAQQRFLLNETGNAFVLRKSNTLDPNMMPDAYYIDPKEPAVLNAGRINADGATAELILYKNGTADVTGGKGSTFIFIPTEMKTISVSSNKAEWGTAKIKKDKTATGYANGAFIFSESTEFEAEQTVLRSQKNTVSLVAEPTSTGKFLNWTNLANSTELGTEAAFSYSSIEDLSAQAVFQILTSMGNVNAVDVDFYISGDKSQLTASSEVKEIVIFDAAGRCMLSTPSNALKISPLRTGVYLVKFTTDKGEMIAKFVK